FKIKRHTPLERLFQAFCDVRRLDRQRCRFWWESFELQSQLTPELAGIADEDIIRC
ncbi:uncharacterized protein MONBRDRAFT_3727, partial [Monosiga brevicollis MX1]